MTLYFFGYLRWEGLVDRHLPERCLRQYGYVQDIMSFSRAIRDLGVEAQFHAGIWSGTLRYHTLDSFHLVTCR